MIKSDKSSHRKSILFIKVSLKGVKGNTGKKEFGRDEGEARAVVKEEASQVVWSRRGSILGDVEAGGGDCGGSRKANHFSHYPAVSPDSWD